MQKHHDSNAPKYIQIIRLGDRISSRIDKSHQIETIKYGIPNFILRSDPITGESRIVQYSNSYENKLMDFLQSLKDEIDEKKIWEKIHLEASSSDENTGSFQGFYALPSDSRVPMNDHSLLSHVEATSTVSVSIAPQIMNSNQPIPLEVLLIRLSFPVLESRIIYSKRFQDLMGWSKFLTKVWRTFSSTLEGCKVNVDNVSVPILKANVLYPRPKMLEDSSLGQSVKFVILMLPKITEKEIDSFIEDLNKRIIETILKTLNNLNKDRQEEYKRFLENICTFDRRIKAIKSQVPFNSELFEKEFGEEIRMGFKYLLDDYRKIRLFSCLSGDQKYDLKSERLCITCGFVPIPKMRRIKVCEICRRIVIKRGIMIDDYADVKNRLALIRIEIQDYFEIIEGTLNPSLIKNSLSRNEDFQRGITLSRSYDLIRHFQDAILFSYDRVKIKVENLKNKEFFQTYHGIINKSNSEISSLKLNLFKSGFYDFTVMLDKKKRVFPCIVIRKDDKLTITFVGIHEKDKKDFNALDVTDLTFYNDNCDIIEVTLKKSEIHWEINKQPFVAISLTPPKIIFLAPSYIALEITEVFSRNLEKKINIPLKCKNVTFNKKYPFPKIFSEVYDS